MTAEMQNAGSYGLMRLYAFHIAGVNTILNGEDAELAMKQHQDSTTRYGQLTKELYRRSG